MLPHALRTQRGCGPCCTSGSSNRVPAARSRPGARQPRRDRLIGRCTAGAALWDDSMTLYDLQTQLDMAVEREDYALAARIRDTLQKKQSDAKLAVEDANRSFYDAFTSGSMKRMEEVWGQGDHVQTVHPGAGCIAGRDQVMESWSTILKGVRPGAFKVRLDDVRVYAGDTDGFVTCVEVIDADESEGRIVATNVFEKQNGKWVITHHHGSPVLVRSRR